MLVTTMQKQRHMSGGCMGNVSMYTLKVDQQLHAFAMKFPFTETPNFAMSCIPFQTGYKVCLTLYHSGGYQRVHVCVCARLGRG